MSDSRPPLSSRLRQNAAAVFRAPANLALTKWLRRKAAHGVRVLGDLPLTHWLRQNTALGLLGLAHLPFLIVYFSGLWQREHYQFFPFALIAFFGLYISRRDRTQVELGWTGRCAIAIDMLLLLVSSLANWPKLTAVGFVFYCFALTRGTWEWQLPRRLTSLTLIPLILVTPPRGLDIDVIFWLQKNTTWLASRMLEGLGHLHLRRGNIIELVNKELLVEEACSGVQSLFTVLFLALFIICLQRRRILHAALLIPAGFLLAGTMNIFRVVVIAVAWQQWQLDITEGWKHDALGYTALLGAILLLVSTDALLSFFLTPFNDHVYGQFAGMYTNPLTTVWNCLCGDLLSNARSTEIGARWDGLGVHKARVVAVVAVSLQGVILLAGGMRQMSAGESDPTIFSESLLPEQIEGFRVIDYSSEARNRNNNWGQYSNVWRLRGHGLNAFVSCDHPFLDWHYLNLCYTGSGWTVNPTSEFRDDPEWRSATFELKDEQLGRHGRVIYSHFSASGRPMQPSIPGFSVAYVFGRLQDSFSRGLWSLMSEPADRTSYQVQIFADSSREITDEQLVALKKLHLATRGLLHQHFSSVRLPQTD